MNIWREPVGIIMAACALEACAVFSVTAGEWQGNRVATEFAAEAQEQPSLHDGLLVLDSHLDTPIHFARGDYALNGNQSFEETRTQVDLGRMQSGGLDGGFFVIYTPQGELTEEAYRSARDDAIMRAAQVREAAAKHHEEFELAFTADDAARIEGTGKRIIYQ
ncbi:MAG: membrane dipeptidase, partial [Pseudomonadota bacterium]